ncbi:hypothetical protein [uncultured Microbulbifer sp.]|uniref:hypothetical protein n=1 Tax=uncultured Microbulbifer sp. TaxID=348147 RepID=UPI002628DFFA|nr:hypothetical protein [uncultured Microbulbifer sp.]
MNKFKVFFTFIAFFWLLLCGAGAIYAITKGYVGNSLFAWVGLLINAWALPVWMLLRYRSPEKLAGDLRESAAFSCVLVGLAIVLLTDSERGLPVYLAIGNLFVLLVYLYHLSAVGHPKMPALDEEFPPLAIAGDGNWQAAAFCREKGLDGVLVIFLRGSYCADSRHQLHQVHNLLADLARRNIGLLLLSGQPENKWAASLTAGVQVQQLEMSGKNAVRFAAPSAAPLILRPWVRDAVRPSAWLIDAEGVVLWRELSMNYRVPAGVDLLRAQLFRVED